MKTLLRNILTCTFLTIISIPAIGAEAKCKNNDAFLVGTGVYDITGPAAERGMMGYAQINQKTSGILQRDWARAFIIKSPCNGKEVVFVNTDLGQLFQGVQQEVLKKLKEKYGDQYRAENVILSAIHQHSGPGGYASHALYNLTTLGFAKKNFATISNGIVKAIERAHANMQPATIRIAQGNLSNASSNRSPSAYLLNPKIERGQYKQNRDTTMTLLRFDDTDDKPLGMVNWFAVHGTSLDNKNTLISGDNKGYAAYLFEKDFGAKHRPGDFVAAFAQSDAGDVSPNKQGQPGGHDAVGRSYVEDIGGKQYTEAKKLYQSASINIVGGINYRQQYVDMRNMEVNAEFTGNRQNSTTCPAAIGQSMLAGTSDGPGYGEQGISSCSGVIKLFPKFLCNIATKKTPCQGAKPIILQTNTQSPPWTATILPFSIVTIGDLAIVANPFELTTMAGRRVRNLVAAKLKPMGVKYVVIAGYSNSYAGYVTTAEEYKAQRYEAASDLFGPQSLNAQLQIYDNLATALVENKPAPKSAAVPDILSWKQHNLQTGVVFDAPPIGKHFGDVRLEPKPSYKPGETVSVEFYGGHPKNNYKTMSTFLAIQKQTPSGWITIRTDNDWDTTYNWRRFGIAASIITIDWRIPKNQEQGLYRIVHYGDSKNISGKITPYQGTSKSFEV